MKTAISYRSFLILLVAYMLSFPILGAEGLIGRGIRMTLGLGLMVTAVGIAGINRKRLLSVIVTVLAVLVLSIYSLLQPQLNHLQALRELIFVFVYMRVIYVMGKHVFVSPRVSTANRLYGALTVYLLIAAFFANLYFLMVLVNPASFNCLESLCGQNMVKAFRAGAHMYFSVITITSTGFGDITPTTPFGGMVAAMEALIGQMYVTVVVARLVGLHLLESTPAK